MEYEAVIVVNLIFCHLEEGEIRTPYHVARLFFVLTGTVSFQFLFLLQSLIFAVATILS